MKTRDSKNTRQEQPSASPKTAGEDRPATAPQTEEGREDVTRSSTASPDGDDATKRRIIRAFAYRLAADIELVAESMNAPVDQLYDKLLETLVAIESGTSVEETARSLDMYLRGRSSASE